MNKKRVILFILSFLLTITSLYADDGDDDICDDNMFMHGIIISSNFIKGFSIGIGYNLSTLIYKPDIPFAAWINMGLLFEYKLNDKYRIRNYDYFDILSLGFSGILNYDEGLSIGISPDIGI